MSDIQEKLPASHSAIIPGKRGKLFGMCYAPGGNGPAPVVVLCHGIPGNERLIDFAIYLREQGFCTVFFHYSGNWGSDGSYSMLNCMEDTMTVLDWVKTDPFSCFDTEKVFLVGHSMGGLMASMAIAESDLLKGGVIIMPFNTYPCLKDAVEGKNSEYWMNFYADCAPWLRDFSWDTMVSDAKKNLEAFNLEGYAKKLASKPVLTIAGSRDDLLPREEHLDVLISAIEKEGKGLHTGLTFNTDHGMNTDRNEIKKAVSDYLKSLL